MKLISINSDFMSKCLNNPSFSDCTLIVEGKEFPVSRFLLSMHSTFFEGLFKWNSENEQTKNIKLDEVKLNPFEIILNYMYTGDIELDSTITNDELMDLLSLGHFLGTHLAMEKIANYATDSHIDDNTIVPFLNAAALFDMKKFQNDLMKYLAPKIKSFATAAIFNTFNEDALLVIVDCDELVIDEWNLIAAVEQWLVVNATTKREMILRKIRLSLIPTVKLLEVVRPKNVFSKNQLLDSILKNTKREYEKYRYDPSINAREIKVTTPEYNEQWRTFEARFLSQHIGRVELCIRQLKAHVILILSKENSIKGVYENGKYVFTFEPHQADLLKFKLPERDDSYKYRQGYSEHYLYNLTFIDLLDNTENTLFIY